MSTIKLNQQLNRVEIKEFEIENSIVFNYFNNVPLADRDDRLLKAIYIGVLALMEDRISTFLSKTSNELGTELESLKMIFEMKKELFYKTSIKGTLAEEEIADVLNQYFSEKRINDKAILTGNMNGLMQKNKTGDIVCEVNGNNALRIAIECKFDKSIKLGDIESKEVANRKNDTAWSQLIESQANRGTKIGIIVLDISLVDNSILRKYDNVGYIPGVGLVAIIDSQKGDYSNLTVAYMLARDIVVNARNIDFDKDLLVILINRLIKDINDTLSIKGLIQNNIDNNKMILKQLERSILLMDFNQRYMLKFLKDGILTKEDLLYFYEGDEIKDKYKLIEKEITDL